MGGVVMAFQDYKASLGLLKSPFVGLKHFRKFLTDYNFKTIFFKYLNYLVLLVNRRVPIAYYFCVVYQYDKEQKI